MTLIISVETTLNTSVKKASSLFWDFKSWQNIWSPMQAVEVLYDDGLHQEVIMTVERDGQAETNRTIRFLRENGDIVFFSPEAPPMMTIHRGEWKFYNDAGKCRVKAMREFEINDRYFNVNISLAPEQFIKNFQGRLKNILDKFQSYFDRGGAYV